MDDKENNSPLSGERVEDYRGLTEQEILNLPKNDNKELFLIHRMPEGYNPVRDRKTIMFLEAMFRDGYDIGSSWQENKDTARISELESENAKLREALENIANSTDGNNPGHAVFYFEARKALQGKEAKGE